MKRILVLSDTHRNTRLLKQLEEIALESDYVIHLGDYISDMAALKPVLKEKLICVRGNGDVFSAGEDERVLEIEGVKLFITHGHKYNVKNTLENLGNETLANECAAALYGHTHLFDITEYSGIKLINPGSLFSPLSGVPSYCYLIIWKDKIIPKIVEL